MKHIFDNTEHKFYESGTSRNGEFTFYNSTICNTTLAYRGLKMAIVDNVIVEGNETTNDYGVTIWVDYQDIDVNSIEFQKMILSQVKGISAERVDEIFDDFGFRSVADVAKHLESGKKISGIGIKRLAEIRQKLDDIAGEIVKQKITFILGNAKLARKVYEEIDSIKELYETPYKILDDCGVGFLRSDDIATQKLNVSIDNKERCKYLTMHKFKQFNTKAANFVKYDDFVEYLTNEVEISSNPDEYLDNNSLLVVDGERVYLNSVYKAETQTPNLIKNMFSGRDYDIDNINESIETYELFNDIKLDVSQEDAIKKCLSSRMSIITGGAGVGKSTISKGVIKVLEDNLYGVIQLAPTGRAAARQKECTGKPSSTIHSFIYMPDENIKYNYKIYSNKKIVVIIDEFSMVDQLLFHEFLKKAEGIKIEGLIVVGDPYQLPSVGCGKVLEDLIDSKCFAHAELTKTFRQAGDSPIIRNANKVRANEMIELSKDREFYVNNFSEALIRKIVSAFRDKYNSDIDFYKEFQITSPLNATCDLINNIYRKNNKSGRTKKSENEKHIEKLKGGNLFSVGDKVMNIENDKENEISNGDMGVIRNIEVKKNGKYKNYDIEVYFFDLGRSVMFHGFGNLRLAYCCTTHKLQGSEFKTVLVLIDRPSVLLESRMFYTGITRAKENCIILAGNSQVIVSACKRDNQWMRLTKFKDRLIDCFKV
jgi:exodeoxyribonuclease V alpha subunit